MKVGLNFLFVLIVMVFLLKIVDSDIYMCRTPKCDGTRKCDGHAKVRWSALN